MALRVSTPTSVLLFAFALLVSPSATHAQSADRISAPFLVENVNTDLRIPFDNGIRTVNALDAAAVFTAPGVVGRTDGTLAGTEVLVRVDGVLEPRAVTVAPDGSRLYFQADQGLWVTDGTPAGTTRLTPDVPGVVGPTLFAADDHGLFFSLLPLLDTPAPALWFTDGTPGGTVRLAEDLVVGTAVLAGDLALFTVTRDDGREELWRSDGTPGGTEPFANLRPAGDFRQTTAETVTVGQRALFVVPTSFSGAELWTSDGTAAGTFRLLGVASFWDLNPAAPGLAFAFGRDRMWVTDGTPAGTSELFAGGDPDDPDGPVIAFHFLERHVLFFRRTGSGTEPWISDGTPAGTHLLPQSPVVPPTTEFLSSLGPEAEGNGVAYLTGVDDDGNRRLYVTDYRTLTSVAVLCEAPCSAEPRPLALVGERLYFAFDDPEADWEISTVAPGDPARRLTDFDPRQPFPHPFVLPSAFFDGHLFVSLVTRGGVQLARLDITPPGPFSRPRVLFRLEAPVEEQSSHPTGFAADDATLYFVGTDGDERWVLYRRPPRGPSVALGVLFDGSPGGPGDTLSPRPITRVTPSGVFVLAPLGNFTRLWFSDGIPGGVFRLIAEGPTGDFAPLLWPWGDGVVYRDRTRLFFTDGSDATPTSLARDVTGPTGGQGSVLPWRGRLWYVTEDGVGAVDGTGSDLGLTLDLSALGMVEGRGLLATDSHLFVSGVDAEGHIVLAAYDGDTGEVTPLPAPDIDGEPLILDQANWLAGRGASAYLTLRTVDFVSLVARADAVTGEIVPVLDDYVAPRPLSPPAPDRLSDRVAFLGGDFFFVSGFGEVFRSDGTPEGTGPSTLLPASDAGGGTFFPLPDDRLLYVRERTFGLSLPDELWVTDGSAVGTRRLGELERIGEELIRVGNRIFFAGRDALADVGAELWAVALRSRREQALPIAPKVCDPDRGELCL